MMTNILHLYVLCKSIARHSRPTRNRLCVCGPVTGSWIVKATLKPTGLSEIGEIKEFRGQFTWCPHSFSLRSEFASGARRRVNAGQTVTWRGYGKWVGLSQLIYAEIMWGRATTVEEGDLPQTHYQRLSIKWVLYCINSSKPCFALRMVTFPQLWDDES